jgi:hypothetical protein
MSKKRWFRFFTDHWLNGIVGLTPNEVAAYITIICELYDNEGIVALNVAVMAHRCNMRPTSFQKALDTLLEQKKVSLEEGFLTSKAVSEEIAWRAKLGEKSVKSREKLAEKRNEISGIRKKVTLIENRDKDIYSTIVGSRAPETSQAMQEAAAKSPAVARLLARRRLQ